MPETNPPQPTNYNPQTHFLQVAARSLNKEIREYFDPKGEFDDSNISTPETALKRACLIDPEDSLLLNACKMIFYGLLSGKLSEDIGNQFYGVPKTSFKEIYRTLDSQVILYFKEENSDARAKGRGKHPLDMQLSFRLQTKSEQLTNSDVTQLQNRIRQSFTASFKHYKGLTRYPYNDIENGFSGTSILANSESDAKELYQKCCFIAGCTFDNDYFGSSKKDSFKTETVNVLNEPTKRTTKPRTGFVYFHKAELYLRGNKDRVLVQRYGNKLSTTQIV